MNLKSLIVLMSVPFLAAMGDGAGSTQRGSDFTRGVLGEESRSDPVQGPDASGALEVISAAEADPAAYLWKSRMLVIFADDPQDPSFRQQLQILEREPAALILRDVIIVTDSDPTAASAWRRSLHPEGFSMVLVDKDGQAKLRRPSPWSVREITRAIDKTPLRRQEIGRAGAL